MKLWGLSLIVMSELLAGCRSQSSWSAQGDPYTPRVRVAETNDFTRKPGIAYRFTEAQLACMAGTKLDTNRFVLYVKRRWPIERLRAYCVAANQRPELAQNLVSEKTVVERDLYQGEITGFDRVWVYVSQDDGTNTYFEDAGRNWHRWTYSLNVDRGGRDLGIIEQLPNDFLDSPKYEFGEQAHAANPR
jgi:hypothetical protein